MSHSRYCCVVNCSSRSGGPYNRTIFQVPKDSVRREKWLKLLSPHLRPGKPSRKQLYVCDSHFLPEDVVRDTTLMYSDGTMEEIPRHNVRLKRFSVPSIFSNAAQSESTISQSEISVEEHDYSVKLEFSAQEEHALQIEVYADQNKETLQEEISVKLECQDTLYDLHALIVDVDNSNMAQNEASWVFSKKPTGICWYYVADDYPNATRSILIKDDMTVEIRARGSVVQFGDFKHVSCFDDLLRIMASIAELKLCRGGGNDSPCASGFAKPKSSQCGACRLEQRRKKDSESRKAKRSIAKKIRTDTTLKNLKRKYERLQRNYVTAKEHIESLKLRCKVASEHGIVENIKRLPVQQQEVVKACFGGSQCNSSVGVRYTNAWILECILLKNVSPKAYEYVRSRRLLQVPTVATLNKYLKEMTPACDVLEDTAQLAAEKGGNNET